MVSVDIIGLEAVVQALRRVAVQAEQALVQALRAEAERILEQSRPLVPVDTGLLVSTGMVEALQDGAVIRYGGQGLAPYAVPVHFRTDVHHPHGQAFFLQAPVFAATGDMAQRLAVAVAARLG